MAKIIYIIVAAFLAQLLECLKGEINSKVKRSGDAMYNDIQWEALNYTFYANQNVFLLRERSDASGQAVRTVTKDSNITQGLFADKLIGSPNTRRTLLKVGSGPFWVQEDLYPTLLEPFSDLSIEAHLLHQETPPYASSIDVLFRVRGENLFSSSSEDAATNQVKPCLKATARVGDEVSESVCTPAPGSEYCVAKVPVLISWHEQSRKATVDDIAVAYTFYPATSLGTCQPNPSNAARESSGLPSSMTSEPKDIGSVTILPWEGNVELIDEDPYLGLYIPNKRLGVGQHFVIPITINKMYLDGVCTVKAKARNGIAAVAVKSTNQDQWNTLSMVKQKGTFAMVTAEGLAATTGGSAIDSVEENPLVFAMEFEVINDTSTSRAINWRVDCNLRGEARASRFGTDIPVSDDWIQAIIPMTQETSIANTALLTGREVSVTLDIGVVTFLGDVMDADGHARCRSADVNVLKVRRSCTNVFVDGTETGGAEHVSVAVSLQGHEATVYYSVWVPELPLLVELSDAKLSNIRGWKVAGGRQDEGILEPEQMLNRAGNSNKNICQLKYQQASVNVYTRFYAPNANSMNRPNSMKNYLFGENMEQSVTHLVMSQLRIVDRSIAKIEGTNIIAKSPGNTVIQVTHPRSRQVLGESPLTVAADKVNIAQLQVFLVSGMTLSVQEVEGQGSKVKATSVTALSDLFVEHQEAILNAVVIFDDGTSLPLHEVSTNDYTVGITTLDPHIVLESPDSMQAYPGIIAMGEGSTTIMLEIALPKPCMKRRRSSAIAHNVIPMNFSFNNPKYANLANLSPDQPPASPDSLWRSLTGTPGAVDYGIVRVNFDLMDESDSGKKGGSVISSIPIDIDFNNIYPMGPDRKGVGNDVAATTAPPPEDDNLSNEDDEPLSGIEIGMYVLLGVFSLAILAFMVNCILFMAKYRRGKRVPKAHQTHHVPYPQNWVMFGMQEGHGHGGHHGHPHILVDPAEGIPLRQKDEEEEHERGSSRDEAIGTESEVSIERHGSEEGQRSRGGQDIEETSLMHAPMERRLSSDLQDCGVVMDSDDNEEESSLQELENVRQNAAEDSSKAESSSSSSNSEGSNLDSVSAAVHAESEQSIHPSEGSAAGATPLPTLNTNQSNNTCDVQITMNPSDENLCLQAGLGGMEFSQILDYIDNLKESCT